MFLIPAQSRQAGTPCTTTRASGRRRLLELGYTLIEVMVAVGILGILASMATVSYQEYVQRGRSTTAVSDLLDISQRIKTYELANRKLPDSLADIGRNGALDPWGMPYEYLNLETSKGNGQARKRASLSPLNSDYDLYSRGPDKKTAVPLGKTDSRDDVVRALDGRYIGLAIKLDP
jgi:general secretion pathway protein G